MLLFPVIDEFLPEPSQIRPKIAPDRPKRPLGAHLGQMVRKKLDLKTPKNGQEGPQSAQGAPTWPPRPFEMEAKTLKNRN